MLLHERSTLGVRHEAFRAQNSSHLLQLRHLLRRRDDLIKVDHTFADVLEHGIVTDHVSPLLLDLLMELFAGEDTDSDFLASTSWQDASTADVLVTLGRIDVQLDDHFDTFDELALFGDFLRPFEDSFPFLSQLLCIQKGVYVAFETACVCS